MRIWAFVPARGGSKSIPRKNLVSIADIPLIDYGVRAAQASGLFEHIVCSTDDEGIAGRAQTLGIAVDPRPAALTGDDIAVDEVVREFLERQPVDTAPDLLCLLQPTSPFLLPEHIGALLEAMTADPKANSGQTVAPLPHNHHAWNQRSFANGLVRFKFLEQRRAAYNKQRKESLFAFGNLVAARAQTILDGKGFFAEPSVGVTIAWPYNLDIDTEHDVKLAEAILAADLVVLPHMAKARSSGVNGRIEMCAS